MGTPLTETQSAQGPPCPTSWFQGPTPPTTVTGRSKKTCSPVVPPSSPVRPRSLSPEHDVRWALVRWSDGDGPGEGGLPPGPRSDRNPACRVASEPRVMVRPDTRRAPQPSRVGTSVLPKTLLGSPGYHGPWPTRHGPSPPRSSLRYKTQVVTSSAGVILGVCVHVTGDGGCGSSCFDSTPLSPLDLLRQSPRRPPGHTRVQSLLRGTARPSLPKGLRHTGPVGTKCPTEDESTLPDADSDSDSSFTIPGGPLPSQDDPYPSG